MCDDPSGTVFDEIRDEFESFVSSIVWIGNFCFIVLGAEVSEAADSLTLIVGACLGDDIAIVVIVHGENEIESVKIVRRKLTGTTSDLVTAMAHRFGHPGIGALPNVIASSSGRVASDAVR